MKVSGEVTERKVFVLGAAAAALALAMALIVGGSYVNPKAQKPRMSFQEFTERTQHLYEQGPFP